MAENSPGLMALQRLLQMQDARQFSREPGNDPALQVPLQPPPGAAVASETERVPATDTSTNESQVTGNPPSAQEQMYMLMAKAQESAANQMRPSLDAQKKGISDIEKRVKDYEAIPQQWNVAPILAKVDSDTGSDLLKGYKMPQSQSERQKAIIDLNEALQKSRGELTADQAKQLQTLGLGNAYRGLGMSARLDNSQMAAAAKLPAVFSNDNVIKVGDRQNAALTKAMDLLNKVKSGQKKFTDQLKSEIENDFANALGGGGGVNALGKLERIEFEPYSAKAANFIGKLKGAPEDIGAPKYAEQLLGNINDLRSSIDAINERRSRALLDQYRVAHANNKYAQETLNKIESQRLLSKAAPKTQAFDQDAIAAELARRGH